MTELIDEILADDKILGRTRVLRNSLTRIELGSSPELATHGNTGEVLKSKPRVNGETDETWEIFDDTDFYHQILRDVVDAKKNGDGKVLPKATSFILIFSFR